MKGLSEKQGWIIGVVALVSLAVLLVGLFGPEDKAEPVVKPEATLSDLQRDTADKVMSIYIDSITRVGLEYGIRIDKPAFERMSENIPQARKDEFASSLGGWSVVAANIPDWLISEQDWADSIKESWLDQGLSPIEELQDIRDMVETYKEREEPKG